MNDDRKIELFTSIDGAVDLAVSRGHETAWLTQRQMIDLFVLYLVI